MDDIIYLDSESSKFVRSMGGLLSLKSGEKEYTRVSLHRAFPFSHANKYISVRDKDGKEIGIIRDIQDFSEGQIKLIEEELNRQYLLPVVKSINSIKEEFGYSYWDVTTDIGPKRFTIKKDNSSFINIKDNRILLIDVDGNRYEIRDYTRLDSKSYKLVELLL